MFRDLLRRVGLAPAADVEEIRQSLAVMTDRNRMLGARLASGVPMSFHAFTYEMNARLKGALRWDVYDQMVSDPAVKQALRCNTLPLINGRWEIKPATDEPRDIEIAEFVAANLLRQSTKAYGREYWCETSWKAQRLPEILDMLRAGFSMFAKSTREVNGKIVYDRLQWLEPQTVDPHGWTLNKKTDDIEIVARTYRDTWDQSFFLEPIKAAQIALYVWELQGARFEGRPFIRPMFGAWFRKDFIQKMAAIWAQKVGAPAPYGSYPDGWDLATQRRFDSFLQALRGTAPTDAYGMFPAGSDGKFAEIKFAGSDAGEVDRMGGLVDGENAEIARAGGTKTQLLGETQTGSRALAQPQGQLEALLIQAVATVICEFENHGAANLPGLVQQLVDWNFSDVSAYPELVCSKLSPYEGLENVTALVEGIKVGLVPKVPELAKQFVERAGFELPDDAYEMVGQIEPPPDVTASKGNGKNESTDVSNDGDDTADGADGVTPEETASYEALLSSASDLRQRIDGLLQPASDGPAGPSRRRRPNKLEARFVDLAAVLRSFEDGERRTLGVLRQAREKMVKDLVTRVITGKISPRQIESQYRSKPRSAEALLAAVRAALDAAAQDGKKHVRGELDKMRERAHA